MAANEQALGNLHNKVAEVLTELLDGTDIPTGEEDEDGNAVVTKLPPSAAVITSAIQFLKNNNITCTPAEDNRLGELEKKFEERRKKLKANHADMAAAKQDMGFMSGLPN